MIPKKPTISRPSKMWRLGKDGFELVTGIVLADVAGTSVKYDEKYKLPEKNYRETCDVCIAREQGFTCQELLDRPGAYEYEGGCMDCHHKCRKDPVHVGVRNYCKDHWPIMAKKLGVGR